MSEDTPEEPGALAVLAGVQEPGQAADRRERLKQVFLEARGCTRCAQLAATRTSVVFGAGHADASLMLVAEVPSAREDEEGVPFTGAAGKLLDDLLESIGVPREDVFVTHALKCRPPGNRDADPSEVAKCRPYLEEQVRLVQPRVICTLGNFATRALTGDATPVKQRHGRPEAVVVGDTAVYVVPLYHPAAALYTRTLLDALRADFATLPELMARPALPRPEREPKPREPAPVPPESAQIAAEADALPQPEGDPAPAPEPDGPLPPQLGLF